MCLDVRRVLRSLIICPVFEKSLSQGTEEAKTLNLWFTSSEMVGKTWWFCCHQIKESSFRLRYGSSRYLSNSAMALDFVVPFGVALVTNWSNWSQTDKSSASSVVVSGMVSIISVDNSRDISFFEIIFSR